MRLQGIPGPYIKPTTCSMARYPSHAPWHRLPPSLPPCSAAAETPSCSESASPSSSSPSALGLSTRCITPRCTPTPSPPWRRAASRTPSPRCCPGQQVWCILQPGMWRPGMRSLLTTGGSTSGWPAMLFHRCHTNATPHHCTSPPRVGTSTQSCVSSVEG